ncbi:MAG: cupin domain-containing protein [Deltaproteobacteria bacterium]|nr:cupin domain-containing protein [Deltaproteobacteria bacterium]
MAALVVLATATSGRAAEGPAPILPDALRWESPPDNPAVRGAWVLGAERAAGPYLFRVRLDAGARLRPHVHPDVRHTTVLSGTLWVGFGEVVDDARLVAVPAGAVYVAPAGVPHWIAARDGAVVYQESGVGPTATTPLGRGSAQ